MVFLKVKAYSEYFLFTLSIHYKSSQEFILIYCIMSKNREVLMNICGK